MKVRFSKLALAELDDVLAKVRAENPAAAVHLNERISRVVDRIGQFPEGSQRIAERPAVRRAPLIRYPYVIYYSVIKDEVMILRILHGARRTPWE